MLGVDVFQGPVVPVEALTIDEGAGEGRTVGRGECV